MYHPVQKCGAIHYRKFNYCYYRDQPEPVIKCCLFLSFFQSRLQGPAFRCDKIVVIVTLLQAIEGIPDKDYNFRGNENFNNLYERLLYERKRKSGYLERRIYERSLHLRVNLLSRIKANIFQNYLYINRTSISWKTYVPVKSKLKHPPGIPRAFDIFSYPGGREFD